MANPDAVRTIFIVDGSIAKTGAFVGARNVARALKGIAEVVLVLPQETIISASELEDFAAVHRLPIANLRRSARGIVQYLPLLLFASLSLLRLMRSRHCDHLILNDFYLMHGATCRLLGFRGRIVTWVRIDPQMFGSFLANTWLQFTASASSELVAVSAYIQKKIVGYGKSTLIYDNLMIGLPAQNPVPERSDRRRIVYIGNYIKGKGQDDALEAYARVANSFPDAELLFFGGDMGLSKNVAYRASLQKRAGQLGIDKYVAFNGFIDDPSVVLGSAYLALNFSRNESFSMTVLEASGAGLPVIATYSGGPEEIIEDGVTGLLVPVGDIDAMSKAVAFLLSDPVQAGAMGEAGRRRVADRFSAEQFRANVLSVLSL